VAGRLFFFRVVVGLFLFPISTCFAGTRQGCSTDLLARSVRSALYVASVARPVFMGIQHLQYLESLVWEAQHSQSGDNIEAAARDFQFRFEVEVYQAREQRSAFASEFLSAILDPATDVSARRMAAKLILALPASESEVSQIVGLAAQLMQAEMRNPLHTPVTDDSRLLLMLFMELTFRVPSDKQVVDLVESAEAAVLKLPEGLEPAREQYFLKLRNILHQALIQGPRGQLQRWNRILFVHRSNHPNRFVAAMVDIAERLDTMLDQSVAMSAQDALAGGPSESLYRRAGAGIANVRPENFSTLVPAVSAALSMVEDFVGSQILANAFEGRSLWDDNLGTLAGLMLWLGELRTDHPLHPDRFFELMGTIAEPGGVTRHRRYFLRNAIQTIVIGRMNLQTVVSTKVQYRKLLESLIVESQNLPEHSVQGEWNEPTVYSDIAYLLHIFPIALYSPSEREAVLSPLLDTRFGERINLVASQISQR
jgi:hypothetical protein